MPIKTTSYEQIVQHLTELGLRPGDDLFVQSRLTSFGRLECGVDAIYQAMRAIIGQSGTIAVPTYCYVKQDAPFDRRFTPSQTVGVLSEYVRTLPGAIRSNCPMHSHAAIGPKAGLLEAVSGEVPLGPGSDFDVLHRAGFRNLILGGDIRIAVFIHHVEAMHGAIPYREWLELPRSRVGADGQVRPLTCRYYGRKSLVDAALEEDTAPVRDWLRAAGKLREVKTAYGVSTLVELEDLYQVVMAELRRDPTVLLERVA